MIAITNAGRLPIALALSLVLTGCGPDTPGPTVKPTATPSGASALPESERPHGELIIGCWSIEAAECRFVAEQIVSTLPVDRGAPFAVEVQLFPCDNARVPCVKSLLARQGKATIEFLDGGEPIDLWVNGSPESPKFAVQDSYYLDLMNPSSARVGGVGPFPFDIGHCGISHVIDFDGSFWVPVGQVDGDHQTVINSESGTMRLLAPNVAEFRGESGFVVQLARFPGPRHFWACS